MNWRTQWFAIAARIRGLVDACAFLYQCRGKDGYSAEKHHLLPQCRSVREEIQRFLEDHSKSILSRAAECVHRFLETRPEVFHDPGVQRDSAVQFVVTAFIALQSEFEYHISDLQEVARRQSERAFTHLQRLIVVDDRAA
jgi:hypothetical protein